MTINVQAAWIGFLLGALSGAAVGLFFGRSDWLGGYGSWRRRMLRLGHIAFFGLGFINLGWALTAQAWPLPGPLAAISYLFVAGGILMPLICFLAAWRRALRHLFVLPVSAIVIGMLLSLGKVVLL